MGRFGNKLLSLKTIKLWLFFMILVSASLSAASFINREKTFEMRLPDKAYSASQKETILFREKKDYSAFINEVQSRNIFTPAFAEASISETDVEYEQLLKTIEGLRLVGVVSDDTRKAIIEDTQAKKTYYLKESETFLEHISVEKISDGSVILNFYENSFELYL
ncbi:MAG: hypothetical protein ABH872_03165 [Candidatus Omnitrophota bacterium]